MNMDGQEEAMDRGDLASVASGSAAGANRVACESTWMDRIYRMILMVTCSD
jgi:hypothetical protein